MINLADMMYNLNLSQEFCFKELTHISGLLQSISTKKLCQFFLNFSEHTYIYVEHIYRNTILDEAFLFRV